jgi:hypothetical protein
MASGNRVFRAVRTYFINGVKVPVGALVREGHAVAQDVEHHLEELKIDFEREDILAKKAADAEAAKVKADAEVAAKAEEAKLAADAKSAEAAAAKTVEADAAKVAEGEAKS